MFSADPRTGIISLAEATTIGKTDRSSILCRCVQRQLTPLVHFPPGTELFDFTPGQMKPVKHKGGWFSVNEFPAIKWGRSKDDPAADLDEIEVTDCEGRCFGVYGKFDIRESDLCFRKWEVVKPEWFTVKEVAVILGSEDEPLSLNQVINETVYRESTRSKSAPWLWPPYFFLAEPILSSRVARVASRRPLTPAEEDLPCGGMECQLCGLTHQQLPVKDVSDLPCGALRLHVDEKKLSGYLGISEWVNDRQPWDDMGEASVLRVIKDDFEYSLKEQPFVKMEELFFSEADVENYLLGKKRTLKPIERCKQERTKPAATAAETDTPGRETGDRGAYVHQVTCCGSHHHHREARRH